MTPVASSVAAFIFSQLSLHWLTLFSANSRNAEGTSNFGISNFGISKRGISYFGYSTSAEALDFVLLLLTSDMTLTFLLFGSGGRIDLKAPRTAALSQYGASVPPDPRPVRLISSEI